MPKQKNKSAAIVRKWKKIVAYSCTHGALVDDIAVDALIRLQDNWKPHIRVHLGDVFDTTCWRAGASGTPDESADPEEDMNAGFKFLKMARPTHLCLGNHDIRPYRFLEHKDARIRHAAEKVVMAVETGFRRQGIKTLQDWDVWNYWEFGGWKYTHGVIYNMNAARDMARAFGNVVFGHTHKAMHQKAENIYEHTGICVGTLTRIKEMDYAKQRKSTLGWSQAIVFGECTEDRKPESRLWLIDNGRNETKEKWRLPV